MTDNTGYWKSGYLKTRVLEIQVYEVYREIGVLIENCFKKAFSSIFFAKFLSHLVIFFEKFEHVGAAA